jgi:hypothetical protein
MAMGARKAINLWRADKQSVSHSSEKLTLLFEQFGPALILIDEWVVYARQLIGKDSLPGGV